MNLDECSTHRRYTSSRTSGDYFTWHARSQMTRRRLPEGDILLVLEYGRCLHGRGAVIFVVGRNEVNRFRREGIDLRDLEGIHVVCSVGGRIITTYRNRELDGIRGLR